MSQPPRPADLTPDLARLASAIRALEGGGALIGGGRRGRREIATSWSSVDERIGLARGVVHEWCGVGDAGEGCWTPPLLVLSHLARRALNERLGEASARSSKVLWIGRSVWPYPRTLMDDVELRESVAMNGEGVLEVELAPSPLGTQPTGELLERSLFLDPRDDSSRLWAIDSALRCPSVAVVVADATRFEMAASRRLQLAAEAGGAFALIARPGNEARLISASATRWSVERGEASASAWPRWALTVLRCKGSRSLEERRDRASGSLGQPA